MEYITFNEFFKYGYVAIQTTKESNDMKDPENLKKILDKVGINKKNIYGTQTHSTNILCIDKDDKHENYDTSNIDGYISNDSSYTLVTFYADCLPIFLLDPKKEVFGVLHGGWRGSAHKILECGVKLMTEKYLCDKKDILVCFGIGISKENYEIQNDTVEILKSLLDFNNMIIYRGSKIYLDNMEMNKQIALNCGIDAKHIFTNNYCTYDGNFFSYRRDKTAKRMAAIISKKGSK
ncbi:hypothetical protein VC03_03195 [Sneathia vaginalis]|uniref:Purine nucleoside phosphorylase n=1 Tax=Sneathia vaginalis TaxID=187101 RepID=A0A0E3UUR6_9FUSO|nr:polyphenol oxidase family protein [Sneathia vaginalis]AKC95533.1 hypothetical protein VC03_03195 [Sneathia vaginalis]